MEEIIKDSSKVIRPWGYYYILKNPEIFKNEYFKSLKNLNISDISPKILVVNPNSKLSWQYHNRREEYWHIIEGEGNIFISNNDIIPEPLSVKNGDTFHILKTQRHRIETKDKRVVIAEIWHHTEEIKSDENDIIRVQSDY